MIFRIKQFLVACDQLINTLLGGYADESLSSRAHRTSPHVAQFIDALFFWEPNHCYNSYLAERQRLQCPPEFRS